MSALCENRGLFRWCPCLPHLPSRLVTPLQPGATHTRQVEQRWPSRLRLYKEPGQALLDGVGERLLAPAASRARCVQEVQASLCAQRGLPSASAVRTRAPWAAHIRGGAWHAGLVGASDRGAVARQSCGPCV